MDRYGKLVAGRIAERQACATKLARAAVAAVSAKGIRMAAIGSLAEGRFMLHSDVDFLVGGDATNDVRRNVERAIWTVFADSGIAVDIVYESDLDAPTKAAFSNGKRLFGDLRDVEGQAPQNRP